VKRTDAGLWIPNHLKPAHKPVAIVFWFSRKLNRINIGLPEQYPVPAILANLGFEKIVCRNAHDVDLWSQKVRDQEKRDSEMSDEQRYAFEGPLRAELRKDLVSKMINSRNQLNRDFCRAALQRMDEDEAKHKMDRVSFQHVEAFEDGK
jgi:hypothetical protein